MMGRNLRQRFQDDGIDLPLEQWAILVQLWLKDGQTQQQLAEQIFRDKGTTTRAIDELEKRGWLFRQIDPADRRHNRIFLTPSGSDIQPRLVNIALHLAQDASAGLTAEELDTCKHVLRRIHDNLQDSAFLKIENCNHE